VQAESAHGEKHDDGGENHEIGVEEQEDAGVVEAPAALQATGRLCHAPGGDQQGDDLPVGAMKVLDVGKSGQTEAGSKGTDREENGSGEGFLPQAEDGEVRRHSISLYRARVRVIHSLDLTRASPQPKPTQAPRGG
jgi:hypothetical protein